MMPEKNNLYAGFDLGGTKISMSIIDGALEMVRREKINAAANISSAGGEAAAASVLALIARSGYLPDIRAFAFAIAGYSNKIELDNFEQSLRHELGDSAEFYFMPDYQIFFHAKWSDFLIKDRGLKNEDNAIKVIVICGTGSVVIVRANEEHGEERIYKIFGGGPVISDPGSGFDLGLRFLRRYGMDAALGRNFPEILSVIERHGVSGLIDSAGALSPGRPDFAARVASFAPALLDIAENIEETPYFEDVSCAAKNLVSGIRYIFKNNFKNYIDKPVEILFNGSVLLRSEFYKNIMKRYIRNYIDCDKINFYEAAEDASVICARYSASQRVEVR